MNDGFNGRTKTFGVLGDPIAHTFSPQIHSHFALLCGLNMAYLPFHVAERDLPDALAGAHALGIGGLNVTIPHKRAVMPFLAGLDPLSAKVGAVNTLVLNQEGNGYLGYNTDVVGIVKTLTAIGYGFEKMPVVVIGAGGSAYAACIAAASQNAARITIMNRTHAHAAILASQVKQYYNTPVEIRALDDPPPVAHRAIVIQTTSVGFGVNAGLSPVTDAAFFEGVTLAFDIIYTPWETPFLAAANAAGKRTVNGFPMLVYQAAAAFALWRQRFFDAAGCEEDALSEPKQIALLAERFKASHSLS